MFSWRNSRLLMGLILTLPLATLVPGAGATVVPSGAVPTIKSISLSPSKIADVTVGASGTVKIKGTDLALGANGDTPGSSTVTFLVHGTSTALSTANNTTQHYALGGANGTEIDVAAPNGSGSVDIEVATSAGSSVIGASKTTGAFSYTQPKFTKIAYGATTGATCPDDGCTGVTVTGTSMGGITGVTVGGHAAANVSSTDTTLTFDAPAGSGKNTDIVASINLASDSVTFSKKFSYAAPKATAMSVSSGNEASQTAGVIVTGTNFGGGGAGTATVHVGAAAGTITAWSETSITFTAPPSAAAVNQTVTFTNHEGDTFTSNKKWSWLAPKLTNISPTSGGATVNVPVTINGTNLDQVTFVVAGGANLAAGSITARTAGTSITFNMPQGVKGNTESVTVTDGVGTSPTAKSYKYT